MAGPDLVIGDPHLARSAWAGRPGLEGDAHFALRSAVEAARSVRPARVLLAGDVLDSDRPESEDVACLLEAAEDLHALGARVLYVQGQHETARRLGEGAPRPWPALSRHAEHAHGLAFALADGRTAVGLDYRPAGLLGPALESLPAAHTLFCHQGWAELMPPGARPQGRLAGLRGFARVITGDLHRHLSLEVTAEDDGRTVRVLSPGSLCPQSSDEEGPKALFLLLPDGTWRSLPLPSRPVLAVHVHSERDLEAALRRAADWEPPPGLPPGLARPVVRLRYLPGLEHAVSALRQAWDGRGHLFPSALRREREKEDGTREGNDLPPAELALRLLAGRARDPDDREWALALCRAASPREEARRLVEAALTEKSED